MSNAPNDGYPLLPVPRDWRFWMDDPVAGLMPPERDRFDEVPLYLRRAVPFEKPEDSSERQRQVAAQSMAHAQDVLGGRASNPYQEAPGAWASIGRGMTDVYRGAEILGLRGLQALPGGEAVRPYEKEVLRNNQDENTLYQRGRGLDTGLDWWRLGGQLAASAPVTLVPPLGAGSAGAIATGALQGGLVGATTATGESKSTLVGAADGAAGGAGFGALMRGVVAPAIRAVVSRYGNIVDPRVVFDAVSNALKSSGVDFHTLPPEVQEGIRRQLAEGLNENMRRAVPRPVGLQPPESELARVSQQRGLQLPELEQVTPQYEDITTRAAPTAAPDRPLVENVAADALPEKTTLQGMRLPRDRIQSPPKERGTPPIGDDGFPVELHHRDQNPAGPLDEMTRTDHRLAGNFSKNHDNVGREKSQIDRNAYKRQWRGHWKKEWDDGRWE